MKIFRRDLVVAAVVASSTFAVMSWAQTGVPKQMISAVFEWAKLEAKPTPVGERREIFDAPTATLDRLRCHATTVRVGEASHPPHRHPEEELIFVKEGTLEVTIEGRVEKAGPGSVIFYASNELHGMRNGGDVPATYYVLRWHSTKTAGDAAAAP
jgi:mannose-6-phosphate isomerase-like protein (cupin superfamily)